MENMTSLIIGIAAVVACAIVAGWLVRARLQGTPIGPALPPQPPDREFSEEVIALNNEAVEMKFSDREAAMRLYDEALKRDPEYWIALANKAYMLLDSKNYDKATRYFEKLTELRPMGSEYYVGRARCLHFLGRNAEARDQLLKAVSVYNYRMEESPFHARLNRAVILFLLHRNRLARSELDDLGTDGMERARV